MAVDGLTYHGFGPWVRLEHSALHIVCALKVKESKGRKSRDRVRKKGTGSRSAHGDGKFESGLLPKPEKGPRWRSWVHPSQSGLGSRGGKQGRGCLLEQGTSLPRHLGASSATPVSF